MKIICTETEKKWLIKALSNSEYGCPKLNSLSRCITNEAEGRLTSTFENCIVNQLDFDIR
jgi:hypothetical protein